MSKSSPVAGPDRKRDSMGRFVPSGRSKANVKNFFGWDGANWWSPNRGYIYYPTLSSRRDLDTFSLYQLRRRSRWLYNNSGFATRCIDGVANMIGSLSPIPLTSDKEWNAVALASFNRDAGSNLTFDIAGKYNFWSCQPMLTRCRMLDGDILAALTESASGIASSMFYEAHQIDNSSDTTLDQSQWSYGVRTTPQGRPIGYRVVTGDDITGAYAPFGNGQKSADIPSSSAIFHCEYRRPGRLRGEPALRHAVNNLIDRSEIMAFTKTSIKNASMIGYQVVRNAPTFMGGPVLPPRGTGLGPQDLSTFDPLSGTTKNLKAENPFGSGKQAEMDPGEEIKLLLDQRPHPNQMEFLDYLARDIGWGLNCSSDILWNMAKLGGATVRYVLADAQQTLIEPAQELLADQFCTRFWVYYVAKEMKARRLQKCQDPEWWKVGWQPQRKLTVDIGRDGKLFIEMHKTGMITLERFHAQQGNNWQVEMDKYLDERKYVVEGIAKRGLTIDQAFPPEPGTANIQQREQIQGSPEDQPPTVQNKATKAGESMDKETIKILATIAGRQQPSITINTPPPIVNIDKMQMPEQKPPIVNVAPPPAPIVNVAAPVVNVAPPPAPIVNVAAPIVNVAPPPAPIVNVEIKPQAKTKSVKFIRDKTSKITGAEIEKE